MFFVLRLTLSSWVDPARISSARTMADSGTPLKAKDVLQHHHRPTRQKRNCSPSVLFRSVATHTCCMSDRSLSSTPICWSSTSGHPDPAHTDQPSLPPS